jgi:hypothetical protein
MSGGILSLKFVFFLCIFNSKKVLNGKRTTGRSNSWFETNIIKIWL